MRRLRTWAPVIAIVALAQVPASAVCACGGGGNGWSKDDAAAYAHRGLHERYVYGGAKGWINNNTWDSSSTEGVDCSEYTRRAWALPRYFGEREATSHGPTTYNWFYGQVGNTTRVSSSDMRSGNTFGDPLVTAWVYRDNEGGPGDHMGMFWYQDSSGYWRTLEARGSDYGIVSVARSLRTLIGYNYRRYERVGWYRY